MQNIVARINQLRKLMLQENLSAFIIPGTDPFLSEYIPECWTQRQFISGFTGSAGKVVITHQKAGLWTDSRYFIQAEKELQGSGIELFKMGLSNTPTLPDWLKTELNPSNLVGVNASLFSVNDFNQLKKDLSEKQIILQNSRDLVNEIWTNRPLEPMGKAVILNEEIAGESVKNKLDRLRDHLDKTGLDAVFVSSLDEVAWLFNLRGMDIAFNPVCIALACVSKSEATLYIHPAKVSDELAKISSINCVPISKIDTHISQQKDINKIGFDPAKLNFGIFNLLDTAFQTVPQTSWVNHEKAQKNPMELKGTSLAMQKDGVALLRFFMWLENSLDNGDRPGEYEIGQKLKLFRSQQNGFKDESFATIAGYNENGAIVHYSAQTGEDKNLAPQGVLLLDSGGQYETGTTDITRTVALGEVSEEIKTDYTLVLKGHLALSYATFPVNTRGDQLDALARQFLWANNLDYGHGTGHGVGHYLNVHEGPHSIRKEYNPVTLVPGMICSVEPGIYKSGKHGIRIENLVVAKQKTSNDFGDFLTFETLTLFPYDLSLIKKELLNIDEIKTINAYHDLVYKTLSPLLNKEEIQWLRKKTQPI